MAIYDALLEICDNVAMYSTDTSVDSVTAGNVIDMTAPSGTYVSHAMGAGEPMWLNIKVGATAFAGGTSAQFKLMSHSTTATASGVVVFETPAIETATLVAGFNVWRCPLPENFAPYRYVGLVVTCVGAMSAGTVDCWIDNGSQSSFDVQVSNSNI
jgi:hypothetical protein